MKNEGSLARKKNTFEKKNGLHWVFTGSPEFRVDPSGRLVIFGSIASPNLE
jgi:hypothetical protein